MAAGSIETVRCTDCPALKPKLKGATYHVDAITPGTQKVEVREENGQRKIFRTEAWMGGSPVLFVSKAPAVTVEAADGDLGGLAGAVADIEGGERGGGRESGQGREQEKGGATHC